MKNKPIPKWKLERQLQITKRVTCAFAFLVVMIIGFSIGICVGYFCDKKYTENYTREYEMAEHDFDVYAGFLSDDVVIEEVSAAEVEVVEIGDQVEQTEVVEFETEEVEPLYSEDEMCLLATLIYAEGGTTSDDCMRYIGSVAMNRVKSDLYPNNLYDVIYDRHWGIQYACAYNGAMNKTPDERAMEIATEVLDEYYYNGKTFLPDNVLGQAGFVTLHGEYCRLDGVIFSYY